MTYSPGDMNLTAVETAADIPDKYRGTPIADLLEYHNLDRPFDTYTTAKLLVGMCMDSRKHLKTLADAGAIAYLFGGGADGTTCACDGQRDGVTNPAPINGNARSSYSADDDGGYLRHQARAYYRAGAPKLP